jgi:hypothetical protein
LSGPSSEERALGIAWLAIATGLLALIGFNSAFLVAVTGQHIEPCMPYFEGCISISKASRSIPALYVYRASIIPSAVLMVAYWWLSRRWLLTQPGDWARLSRMLSTIGIIASLSLLLYALYLGDTSAGTKAVRRYGAALFFAGTGLAQLILTGCVWRLARRGGAVLPKLAVGAKVACTGIVLVFAASNVVITHYDINHLQNVIEWNVAALMAVYFMLSAPLWSASRFAPFR